MKIDPHKHKEVYDNWKSKVKDIIPGIGEANSKLILSYLSDMEKGINISSGSVKGPRSFSRLLSLKNRLVLFARKFKELYQIEDITKITEEQLVGFFADIRSGTKGKLINKYYKVKQTLESNWLKNKQRLLIPFRIAIKCQDELGLVLRNDITWVKQLCNFKTKWSIGASMPSAVKDRLNTNSESIFFFVKSNKYYFNLDKIRVPYKELETERGKNPGDCIMFPLEPSKEKHYAMFPSTIPEFCIKAGCPDLVCKKCGMPRLTIKPGKSPYSFNLRVRDVKEGRIKSINRKASKKEIQDYNEKKYTSREKDEIVLSCNCKAGFKSGVVLDPFIGSGTTAIVAKKLGMNFLGFDLNKNYIKIANRRISKIGN